MSRADLFRPSIVFKEKEEIILGWGDRVQIGVVKEQNKLEIASGQPGKVFQTLYDFQTPFIISGLAPFKKDQLLVLAFKDDIKEYQNVDVLTEEPLAIKVKAVDFKLLFFF